MKLKLWLFLLRVIDISSGLPTVPLLEAVGPLAFLHGFSNVVWVGFVGLVLFGVWLLIKK